MEAVGEQTLLPTVTGPDKKHSKWIKETKCFTCKRQYKQQARLQIQEIKYKQSNRKSRSKGKCQHLHQQVFRRHLEDESELVNFF